MISIYYQVMISPLFQQKWKWRGNIIIIIIIIICFELPVLYSSGFYNFWRQNQAVQAGTGR